VVLRRQGRRNKSLASRAALLWCRSMFDETPKDLLVAENVACLRGERTIFVGLNFVLEAGGALLLAGPNGSGKTSLLRLLAGLAQPAVGQLLWNGHSLVDDREAHAARLRYVGHQDALKPALTVVENLVFWARLGGQGATRTDALAALTRFGLGRLADEPARVLSAGQRRRLALSRLLVAPVRLWLLDEPNTALDVASLGVLAEILDEHRRAGGMVVLSSHADLGLDDAQPLLLSQFTPRHAVEAAA
jgi:heme exporter protein A